MHDFRLAATVSVQCRPKPRPNCFQNKQMISFKSAVQNKFCFAIHQFHLFSTQKIFFRLSISWWEFSSIIIQFVDITTLKSQLPTDFKVTPNKLWDWTTKLHIQVTQISFSSSFSISLLFPYYHFIELRSKWPWTNHFLLHTAFLDKTYSAFFIFQLVQWYQSEQQSPKLQPISK